MEVDGEVMRRAVLAGAVLAPAWAAAFALTALPWFPLVAAGGVVAGLAGLWARRGGTRARVPPLRMQRAAVGLAMGAAAAHLVVTHLAVALAGRVWPGLMPSAADVHGGTRPPLWAALLIAGMLTAPLSELYWRGALHPALVAAVRRTRLRGLPGATTGLGAVVYATFHLVTGEPALVGAALLGGLVWCWLAERTGTVGAPMLAHALWACGLLVAGTI